MKDNLNIKGTVFLKLQKSNGEIYNHTIENIVVNTGKEFFAKKIFDNSFIGYIAKIGIGTNLTDQTVNDNMTSFDNGSYQQIKKSINSESSGIETVNGVDNAIDYVTTFFDTTEDTFTNGAAIQELVLIGLNDDSPQEEVLICRTTFDDSPSVGFNKEETDIVTITWRITIN